MNCINFITGEGYKVINYPDGEKHLKIDELDLKQQVVIDCRITNSDDLFILMQLSDILNRLEVKVCHIRIWYLMGMRCDRLFSMNEAFTLKLVANVINSFNSSTVEVVEAHSNRTGDLIKNYCSVGSELHSVYEDHRHSHVFCLPDKGAALRYRWIKDCITCEKVRDVATGELKGFSVGSIVADKEPNKIMVMDDLCDGGGTFVGIAELLRKEYNPKELCLAVVHAIQEEGIKRVASVYDKIYITNSYRDWDKWEELPKNVHVTKFI